MCQNLVPNPSFESGDLQPSGWMQLYGNGKWENFGRTGTRCVSVSGTSDCGNRWATTGCAVEPGKLYVVRFWMMAPNPLTLQAFVGWDQVSRNISVDEPWRSYLLYAAMPSNMPNSALRVGQCRAYGTIAVDDVEVRPAVAIHQQIDGHYLGSGESLRPGKFIVQSLIHGSPAQGNVSPGNYSRSLHQHTAWYDTDHWTLLANAYVIYRHDMDGLVFTNAQVAVTSVYSTGGELVVDFSTNALDWVEAARMAPPSGYATRILQTNAPTTLLPTTSLFVRLRSTTGTLHVSKYRFEADVPENTLVADGKTWFFELDQQPLDVLPVGMRESPTGWVCQVQLSNSGSLERPLAINAQTEGPGGTRVWEAARTVAAQSTDVFEVPLLGAGASDNTMLLEVREMASNSSLFRGSLQFTVAAIWDTFFGYALPASEVCDFWWCEGTRKVSRLPRQSLAESTGIEIAAARNEYEPFQLVLRPRVTLTNVQVSVSDFIAAGAPEGGKISRTNVEVCLVEYVPVRQASDYSGAPGEHPDPLVPLTGAFGVPAETNQPLWFTVYVPKDAVAGRYQGEVRIEYDGAVATAQVGLRVFDFTLPDTTHTRTAYKISIDDYWHKLTNVEQQRSVWSLYMENARRHRITPAFPQLYSMIQWTMVGEEFVLDTTAFDVAMSRYLDEFHFNGFNLMEQPNMLGWYWKTTSEYRRLMPKLISAIMAHLRGKGWAEKAYVWWYDEPNPGVYPNLTADMKAVQVGAADLRRLVTVQADPPVYGSVDTWVPLLTTYRWALSRIKERQALGEDIWWFVSSWPAYPCPNNYIDHPAINHRIRAWMADRYDVGGDLYWATCWYKGTNGANRNPWLETMSLMGYDTLLGNGDGLLLYPPVKIPPTAPVLAGPINSLRWELIREAMEDGEYFWLLRQGLQRARGRLGIGHPAIAEGEAARQQAIGLTRSIDDFEKDPQKLYAARLRLAEAIEALDDGTPTIVTQPGARTGKVGGSVSLRVEALGWPLPGYQWARDGVALPGATTSVLSLTNLTLADAGTYTATVSNALGTVTSAGAKVVVLTTGTEAPQILVQPADLERRTGEKAVLTATVVGTAPLSYQWFTAGSPIPGETNTTLLFTNLAASQFGTYQLVASNLAGSVTSAPARIISVDAPILQANWSPANNGLQLRFSTRRRPATVLVSSNYTSWSELIRVQPAADPVILLDTQATQHTARYYRVRTE